MQALLIWHPHSRVFDCTENVSERKSVFWFQSKAMWCTTSPCEGTRIRQSAVRGVQDVRKESPFVLSIQCEASSNDRQSSLHPKTMRHSEHSVGKKAPTQHRIYGRRSGGGILRVFWDQIAARLRFSYLLPDHMFLMSVMAICTLIMHGTYRETMHRASFKLFVAGAAHGAVELAVAKPAVIVSLELASPQDAQIASSLCRRPIIKVVIFVNKLLTAAYAAILHALQASSNTICMLNIILVSVCM